MALDTTVGGANANSYASVDEFKTYRASRMPIVAAVITATDPQIEAALLVGCRILEDDFDWTGEAVNDSQALTWPRRGMMTRNKFPIPTTVNPRELKTAQCEAAYELLAGANLVADNQAQQLGVSSVKAGDVAVAFQSVNTSTNESVDMMLRRLTSEFNYLSSQVSGEVRRLLVPSWFNQPTIIRPWTFGAF